jgi:hypothetical protein
MLSHQEEQIERRRVLENDKRIREQGSTFLAHTHNDLAGGRFAAVGAATVIGSTAVPQYPQASTPFQRDPVPDEPPLGLDNPARACCFSLGSSNWPDIRWRRATSDRHVNWRAARAGVGSPSQTGDPPEGPIPSLQGQRGLAGSPSRYRRF